MEIITSYNLKGGSCKTTTVASLAGVLKSDYCVLCIDLDGQRSLSFALGVDGEEPTTLDWATGKKPNPIAISENLHVIPGDLEMFTLDDADLIVKRVKVLKGYDLVFIDCPPALFPATVGALMSATRIIMPTLCEPASIKGLSEALGLLKRSVPDTPIDVLRSRYDGRKVLTKQADSLLIDGSVDMGYRLLHTTIPENVAIAESFAQQIPITEYAKRSSGAKAYQALTNELTKLWGLR